MKSGTQILRRAFALASFLVAVFTSSAQCDLTSVVMPEDTMDCGVAIAAPAAPAFSSACCDGPASVTSFQSVVGSVFQSCALSTAYGPGPDWSVWIPIAAVASPYWNFTGEARFEQYTDGTAHVFGMIQNAGNASLQMYADFWMESGRSWSEWSALGRGYKNDLGLAGEHYLDWTYYELVPRFSRLTGVGALAGSLIEMHHMPSTYYYGFQTGVAANNKNASAGMSGWFTYDGQFNGEAVEGHGDLNVNQSCESIEQGCASTSVHWYYRAENTCGQIAYAEQSLVVLDQTAPVISGLPSEATISCGQSFDLQPSISDDCSEVTINYQDEVLVAGCPGQFIRHYTATDACGNASIADVVIYVLSAGELGFIDFPADIELPCDVESIPSANVTYNEVCTGTTLSLTQQWVDGDCVGAYDLLQIYTLTDDCGGEVSRTWTIHVVDQTAPVWLSTPEDLTISCDEEIPYSAPSATDACSDVQLSYQETIDALDCGSVISRTWVATDVCGNTISHTQRITVIDNTPPVFASVPGQVTIGCGENYEFVPSVTDACGTVTVTFNDSPLEGCAGSFARTWTAMDACGNSSSIQTVVTRIDAVAPIMTQFPEDLYTDCSSIPSVESAGIEFTDNCSDVAVAFTEVFKGGECQYDFIIERTWYLTDACGNTSQWLWRIHVVDQTPPVFDSTPESMTITCSQNIPPAASLSATDNCSDVTNVELSETTAVDGCEQIITRVWTATDVCGNSSSHTQVITIVDQDAPIFTFIPAGYNVACGNAGNPGDMSPATAIDLCSDVTISYTDEPLFGGCPGGYIRHWFAQDACGNVSTADQVVTSEDLIAPQFVSFPNDMTAECDQVPAFDDALVSYVDNCQQLSLFHFEIITPGYCPTSYTIERTWVVADVCGNSTSRTWTIYVIDETGPDLSGVPSELTLECGAEVPTPEISTGDNCSVAEDIQLNSYEALYPQDCGSLLVRVWEAYDGCGNVTTAVQNIYFVDQTPPVFTFVPASVELACGEAPTPSDAQALATDNCSEVSVTFSDIPSDVGCAGSMIRRWVAADACGNSVTADQVFVSLDNETPVIVSAPSTATVDCDGVPSLGSEQIVATDNCSDLSIAYYESSEPGYCPSSYTLTRTAVVADACGNSTETSWTYYVIDETAPVISGVPSTIVLECGDPLPEVNISTSDNCSPNAVEVFYETLSIPLECGEILQRIWTATDACGNYSTAIQEVNIVDETPPVLIGFVPEVSLNCGELNNVTVSAQDACSEATLEVSDEYLGGSCTTILRTYRAMDACGNFSVETQIIHVTDDAAPVFTSFPANATLTCAQIPSIENSGVQFTDACSAVTSQVNELILPGDCPQSYTLQRTWVITDACGNTASQTWVIQAIDNQVPQILNVPADVTIDCSDAIPSAPNVTAVDDCDAAPQLIETTATETIGCTTYITRRWYALDACGNLNQAVQLITITDQFAPVLSAYPEDLVLTCGSAVPAPAEITATDNCAGSLPVQFTQLTEGTAGNCSTIIRSWCATDCAGHSTCHTQTIAFAAPVAPSNAGLRAWQSAGQQPMVRFEASTNDRWQVDVMDIQGRRVKDLFVGELEAGESRMMTWSADDLADGIYTIRFTNGLEVLTSRLVIVH